VAAIYEPILVYSFELIRYPAAPVRHTQLRVRMVSRALGNGRFGSGGDNVNCNFTLSLKFGGNASGALGSFGVTDTP